RLLRADGRRDATRTSSFEVGGCERRLGAPPEALAPRAGTARRSSAISVLRARDEPYPLQAHPRRSWSLVVLALARGAVRSAGAVRDWVSGQRGDGGAARVPRPRAHVGRLRARLVARRTPLATAHVAVSGPARRFIERARSTLGHCGALDAHAVSRSSGVGPR